MNSVDSIIFLVVQFLLHCSTIFLVLQFYWYYNFSGSIILLVIQFCWLYNFADSDDKNHDLAIINDDYLYIFLFDVYNSTNIVLLRNNFSLNLIEKFQKYRSKFYFFTSILKLKDLILISPSVFQHNLKKVF